MRKNTTFIILILFALFACNKDNSEPESEESNYHTFEGIIGNNDNSTILSSDDHLIICGNANTDGNWILIKTTKAGQELWTKKFPDDGFLKDGCALTEDLNGNLFVCGNTDRNINISGTDILLVKTNSNGDTLWTKTYGGQNTDHGHNIISTSEGNLLISGFTIGSDSIASTDIYVLKINTNGDTLWTRRFETNSITMAYHLLETKNGEYLITGSTTTAESLSKLYLLKVDANGTKVWDREIGPSTGKTGRSTIELSNEDLLICGENIGYDYSRQLLLLKTDNMGNPIWSHEFGEEQYSEQGNSIKQNQDGSFTITGNTSDPIVDIMPEIILLKVDQSGNQIWFKKFGSPGYDKGSNLIKDTNDDNLITGNLAIDEEVHIFLTRMDKDGNFK